MALPHHLYITAVFVYTSLSSKSKILIKNLNLPDLFTVRLSHNAFWCHPVRRPDYSELFILTA